MHQLAPQHLLLARLPLGHLWRFSALCHFSLALLGSGCTCQGDSEAEPEVVVEVGEDQGNRLPTRAGGADCLAFCQKSNDCARSAGRSIPPAAENCDVSCASQGTHAAAPPAAFECVDLPCEELAQCAGEAMIAHMQGSDVPVFPMNCLGLCNRVAYCAGRTGGAAAVSGEDCAEACEAEGAMSEVEPREFLCANVSCGAPLDRCRREPPDPQAAPSPAPSP